MQYVKWKYENFGNMRAKELPTNAFHFFIDYITDYGMQTTTEN